MGCDLNFLAERRKNGATALREICLQSQRPRLEIVCQTKQEQVMHMHCAGQASFLRAEVAGDSFFKYPTGHNAQYFEPVDGAAQVSTCCDPPTQLDVPNQGRGQASRRLGQPTSPQHLHALPRADFLPEPGQSLG